MNEMEKQLIELLQEIKKELQDIRSILEPQEMKPKKEKHQEAREKLVRLLNLKFDDKTVIARITYASRESKG